MITNKFSDTTGEKKEGNILELSILGMYELNYRTEFKLVTEEICQNISQIYTYEISTYLLESYQGFSNVRNLIEYHHNLNTNYQMNEFKIDNSVFYNGVNYLEKLDEYLAISKYFMKYITNSYITFPMGNLSIVELARCEENMEHILTSLGYKEKSRIVKKGEFFKFRNLPVVIFLTSVGKINAEEAGSTTMHGQQGQGVSSNPQHRPETKAADVNFIDEIVGYCYENEKENLSKILFFIKEKLSSYCIFESDLKINPES